MSDILETAKKAMLKQILLPKYFYLNVVVQILHIEIGQSFLNIVLFSGCTNECRIKDVCCIWFKKKSTG